jgi:hypothetical protein
MWTWHWPNRTRSHRIGAMRVAPIRYFEQFCSSLVVMMLWALSTYAFYPVFDIDRAGFLEAQLAFHRVSLFELLAQLREHHVIAARIKLYRLAGLDFQSFSDLAHLHDVAVHLHLVD